MLNSVEHEKSFITSGPGVTVDATFWLQHTRKQTKRTAMCLDEMRIIHYDVCTFLLTICFMIL